MNKNKNIIKPTLTTHKNLTGQLFYIQIQQILDEISNRLKLDDETKKKLKNHIMTKSDTLFTYKTYNKYHKILNP
jgi:hypothetical protein|tara:strand:- start:764 stop:988 length:225 start_codon:yes stop_codon:yes gene_type:complete